MRKGHNISNVNKENINTGEDTESGVHSHNVILTIKNNDFMKFTDNRMYQ